jgi:hypothetical protein
MASFEEGQRLNRLAHPGKDSKVHAVWRLKHTAPGLKVVWLSVEGYDGR